MSRTSLDQDPAGLQCLDSGGILVPESPCGVRPGTIDFTRPNAYYVSPLVIIENGDVEEVARTDARARGYRTRIETDAAINWIKSRPSDQAWMATVSRSEEHTSELQSLMRISYAVFCLKKKKKKNKNKESDIIS